jgi:hypothetical protein
VELYGQVRRAVYVDGLSRREAARRFGFRVKPTRTTLGVLVRKHARRAFPDWLTDFAARLCSAYCGHEKTVFRRAPSHPTVFDRSSTSRTHRTATPK